MMCVTKGFGLAALFLGLMAGAAGQAVGATIVNGDFEEATTIPGGFYAVLPGGSTAITGWTVTGDSVELVEEVLAGLERPAQHRPQRERRRRHRADLRHHGGPVVQGHVRPRGRSGRAADGQDGQCQRRRAEARTSRLIRPARRKSTWAISP